MNLKKWLILNKISQSELARQLNMSRTHVHVVVNGKTIPGKRFADVIFAYTNGQVKPEDLGISHYKPNDVVVKKDRPLRYVIDL